MTRGWVRTQAGTFELNVRWSVEPGEVHVLFGPSGSGKTMTLRSIAGLVTPVDGHIEIGGATVFDKSMGLGLPPHLRRVGYVPQDWLLFPHLDVAANIGYGLRGFDAEAKRRRVEDLASRVGLAGLEDRRVRQLSGGQQQRVALARALAPDPAVVLLDEPFSALDIETRRQVRTEVKNVLKAANVPVILVTHDREEALVLGDTASVIDDGAIVADGPPLTVLGHPPRERVARLVGVENLLSLRVLEVLPTDGVMRCGLNGFQIEVPLAEARAGEEITIGIRADDVLLASAPPQGISARNVIAGRVASVDAHGAVYEIAVDCGGVRLLSHVTRKAVAELALAGGAPTWAIVKSSSCYILAPPAQTKEDSRA